MMGNFDFRQAAYRHYQSAECLENNQHIMDADHLYGLSAECVLKAMMVRFVGAAILDASGDLEKQHKKHINALWHEYNSAMQGRNPSEYLLPENNPFNDWHVNQRYAGDEAVSVEFVAEHQQATRDLFDLMQQVELSGA